MSLSEVWREIGNVSLPILSLTLVTKFVNLLLGAMRTQVLIRNQHRFTLGALLDSQLAGFAGNNLLPLRFGDLVRIDYMAKRGGLTHSACLQVVVMERLLDVLSLVALCLLLLPFVSVGLQLGSAFYLATVASIGGAVAILAARQKPEWFIRAFKQVVGLGGDRVSQFLVPKGERFVRELSLVSTGRSTAPAFLISVAIWGVSMASVWTWFWAFNVTLPWYAPFLVLIFLAFGMALPATPGQVGTYHYFVAAALTVCGLDRVHALSIAVVAHAASIVPFTILGLPSLIAFAVRRSARGAATAPGSAERVT
ncbi:MAG TPA: lysylphosphatidylglycerol synthase transmembrane domain-containing protein, partial [Polyangiaceae bacterium]|nr:lysylphosphatidylglycerol synthase transmembrane domain-containing protein [Polyangiaceae bacterium]